MVYAKANLEGQFISDSSAKKSFFEKRKIVPVLTLLKENVTKSEGHFYAPLPWRDGVVLPSNSHTEV